MSKEYPDKNIPKAFRLMRRLTLVQSLILWTVTVVVMAAWMFMYHYLGGKSGAIFMVGVFVILLLAFLYSIKIEKQVVCPSCGASLTDIEGWNVYVKQCPHCGVSYEKHS